MTDDVEAQQSQSVKNISTWKCDNCPAHLELDRYPALRADGKTLRKFMGRWKHKPGESTSCKEPMWHGLKQYAGPRRPVAKDENIVKAE